METKRLSLNDCEIKLSNDAKTFGGYASTFNNVDSYGDTILPGAYTDTLAADGLPKMFIQHDRGSLPVGKWIEAKQDEKGLYITGEFTPGMAMADNAKAALQHETIDGLSIGFMLRKNDYKSTDNGRIISRITSLKEISLVTFPADNFARIDMKSEIEEIETIRDFERYLRDVGGLSKASANMLISKAKSLFCDKKEQKTPDFSKILEKIAHINYTLGEYDGR